MRTKRIVSLVFAVMLVVSVGAYFIVHFVIGIKGMLMPEIDGKIKYVTTEGNDVFAFGGAVVFNRPVEICDVVVENDVAKIKVMEFTLVRSPAFGVVKSAENGVIEIDHGNETVSTIIGVSTIGVKPGDLVYSGSVIGSAEREITFSVKVSELPLDMKWLVEEFAENEEVEMR